MFTILSQLLKFKSRINYIKNCFQMNTWLFDETVIQVCEIAYEILFQLKQFSLKVTLIKIYQIKVHM